ncbi:MULTISPECIES: pyridoxamine 5'-phosphate oxidase family protein [unclassified Caballeronia]|uniref:HugZ family pyridoxamine 5'-phosphate oxidase n=1 Tax=unclassified Caballeronia TaxID=2646786 RepID=UPI002866000A|nr:MULTISPECIES: pyridoxamine 5'-phosphate oxidase family protein [unclassified Caballeronia]MDR5749283.1 pyridoxamine 5'-phosphate oxidase family protein [Caballeronia sp. LZ024]MDR5843586.1 pyridoxamine 5'-phosphate oxidase family protein [Caballeronia sp. LZ031]
MNIPPHAPLHLLHRVPDGTLATHSRDPRGFPYPTALPFAPTARHVPMLLISHLAEHTRNLHADSRAGFLVAHASDGNVLEGQRLTMLGSFSPAPPEESSDLARRYLRYHPEAERYLGLGDFTFWTMSLERMRFIGGFGAMGWLAADALDSLEPLSANEETLLCALFDDLDERPATLELLGLDRYGCDFRQNGRRNRFTFDKPKATVTELKAALFDWVERHR